MTCEDFWESVEDTSFGKSQKMHSLGTKAERESARGQPVNRG